MGPDRRAKFTYDQAIELDLDMLPVQRAAALELRPHPSTKPLVEKLDKRILDLFLFKEARVNRVDPGNAPAQPLPCFAQFSDVLGVHIVVKALEQQAFAAEVRAHVRVLVAVPRVKANELAFLVAQHTVAIILSLYGESVPKILGNLDDFPREVALVCQHGGDHIIRLDLIGVCPLRVGEVGADVLKVLAAIEVLETIGVEPFQDDRFEVQQRPQKF